jgi:hypothetical protein
MHNMPIGPTGAAIENPMIKPFMRGLSINYPINSAMEISINKVKKISLLIIAINTKRKTNDYIWLLIKCQTNEDISVFMTKPLFN